MNPADTLAANLLPESPAVPSVVTVANAADIAAGCAAPTVPDPSVLTVSRLLEALHIYCRQRPGFEIMNYARNCMDKEGIRAYNSDVRGAIRDLNGFRTMLAKAHWFNLTMDDMNYGFTSFSGRLSYKWEQSKNGKWMLSMDYCTGQYFCVEYRRACCVVLKSALWNCVRENREGYYKLDVPNPSDVIRNVFHNVYGKTIQKRYFN